MFKCEWHGIFYWWYSELSICEKPAIFSRQFVSSHKYLMCYEGTAVELKLPEGGVNKHRNAQEQELLCKWRTENNARQLVDKRAAETLSSPEQAQKSQTFLWDVTVTLDNKIGGMRESYLQFVHHRGGSAEKVVLRWNVNTQRVVRVIRRYRQ
jgi:hypothetical protein